jgi:hypothetical protein
MRNGFVTRLRELACKPESYAALSGFRQWTRTGVRRSVGAQLLETIPGVYRASALGRSQPQNAKLCIGRFWLIAGMFRLDVGGKNAPQWHLLTEFLLNGIQTALPQSF